MSLRDQHHPQYMADMLDGSSAEPELANAEEEDGEAVTRVHHPALSEPPPGGAPPWHMHLDPRQQAWRPGREGWQPEYPPESSGAHPVDGYGYEQELHHGRQVDSRRGFMFPRSTGASTISSVSQRGALSSSRPPATPYDGEPGAEELLGRSLPPPPRLPSGFPPPRYEDSMIHAEFQEPEATDLAMVPRPAWLLRPPSALDSQHTLPPAVLDAYRGSRVVIEQRTIWFGLGATVALSAAVAALVSSLVWKLNAGSGSSLESALVASVAAARPSESPQLTPEPESVPVDQLPLLDRRAPAPVTVNTERREERAGTTTERSERREARAAEPARAAPVRRAEEPAAIAAVAAAAPSPAVKAAPSKPVSALDSSIAARVALEEDDAAPKRAAERPSPERPSRPAAGGAVTNGPDREGLARAVNNAASAAQSCGTSPENGQVMVKFSPSGGAQSVQLLKPFSNHDVNACVLRAMSRARIAPFSGEAVSVRKSVRW